LQHQGVIVAALLSIAQTVGTANVAEWAKLVLSDREAPVLRVTRLRHDDQARPVALEEVVLPLERFPGLAPNGGGIPDIAELAQRYGLSLGRVTERISIVRATRDVGLHLGMSTGTNVIKLDRITETADGQPVEWRVTFARKTD
jgi:DNA-binding GntR family transcriptional regulator